jgi:hypothetical protein
LAGDFESSLGHQTRSTTSPTPWLASKESDGIAYFLFQTPARIERYDMADGVWLADITLSATPTAFAVDDEGLYVSFGTSSSRFAPDGTDETHLCDTASSVESLFAVGQILYIHYYKTVISVDKLSGAVIDTREYFFAMKGVSVAPSAGKMFARTATSSSDILEVILNSDGSLGNQTDSIYMGDYPDASVTYVFPGDDRVAEDTGIVYDVANLVYTNSLAGPFDDLAFHGESPVVLRGGTLVAYSPACLETGLHTPQRAPLKLYVNGESVFAFSNGSEGITVEEIPVGLLQPLEPGQPQDPNGLTYAPDWVVMDDDEVVYLLSQTHLSVFRWSVPQRGYTETVPLVEAPSFMAYSAVPDRLYLAYPTGKITQIELDQTARSEVPFVNTPQTPCGLSTAGEFVYACDPSGNVSHITYSPTGALLSQVDGNWRALRSKYTWSQANRKMYYIISATPHDLFWEEIDENGLLGPKKDSPYHSSTGMIDPIRVAPDGSVVVLGSGRIYDAISLEQINALPTSVADAAWVDDVLFTVRAHGGDTLLEKWSDECRLVATQRVLGTPVLLLAVDEGLLVATEFFATFRFSIWDHDLRLVHGLPAYYGYLPLASHFWPPPWDGSLARVRR